MKWELAQLEELIKSNTELVVTRETDCLMMTNSDGLEAWLAIHGEQILVESILFAQSEAKDAAQLNETILRTHMMFPLTTVGLTELSGESYYTAFGSLSSQSKETSILIEIETLFVNVESFLDAWQDFLN